MGKEHWPRSRHIISGKDYPFTSSQIIHTYLKEPKQFLEKLIQQQQLKQENNVCKTFESVDA